MCTETMSACKESWLQHSIRVERSIEKILASFNWVTQIREKLADRECLIKDIINVLDDLLVCRCAITMSDSVTIMNSYLLAWVLVQPLNSQDAISHHSARVSSWCQITKNNDEEQFASESSQEYLCAMPMSQIPAACSEM